ncbi:hypothetical protein [uncultured Shimia sp.]|uniref:hypothetical protein n=1 Tax=uncultured Shimia sp. TaxID=573152 RepID=UPI002638A812|nr:hypothetical protein [uncultured Shimia sp.]
MTKLYHVAIAASFVASATTAQQFTVGKTLSVGGAEFNETSSIYDGSQSISDLYLGTELDVNETAALQAEVELSSLSIDGCRSYDPAAMNSATQDSVVIF